MADGKSVWWGEWTITNHLFLHREHDDRVIDEKQQKSSGELTKIAK